MEGRRGAAGGTRTGCVTRGRDLQGKRSHHREAETNTNTEMSDDSEDDDASIGWSSSLDGEP
jgi:hypothetical protein